MVNAVDAPKFPSIAMNGSGSGTPVAYQLPPARAPASPTLPWNRNTATALILQGIWSARPQHDPPRHPQRLKCRNGVKGRRNSAGFEQGDPRRCPAHGAWTARRNAKPRLILRTDSQPYVRWVTADVMNLTRRTRLPRCTGLLLAAVKHARGESVDAKFLERAAKNSMEIS